MPISNKTSSVIVVILLVLILGMIIAIPIGREQMAHPASDAHQTPDTFGIDVHYGDEHSHDDSMDMDEDGAEPTQELY